MLHRLEQWTTSKDSKRTSSSVGSFRLVKNALASTPMLSTKQCAPNEQTAGEGRAALRAAQPTSQSGLDALEQICYNLNSAAPVVYC